MASKRRLRKGSDPRQMTLGLTPTERYALSFAALPPQPVAQQVLRTGRQLLDRFRLSAALRIPHVTLYRLGDHDGIPHDIIESVKYAIDGVRVRSFDTIFDGAHALDEPKHPLVLRCGKGHYGFVALQNAIGNALAGAGADRPLFDARFTPRLALFHGGGSVPEIELEQPIAWRVENFSLILSLRGHKHYEPYGEWALQN